MVYFGCDSGSDAFPCGSNFYIGKLGHGTLSGSSEFNVSAAKKVGVSHTYSYWYVLGPTADPDYSVDTYTETDAENWGKSQANAYTSAWEGNTYVGGTTLFADIEGSSIDGWLASGNSLNRSVYQGFSKECNSFSAAGVYSSIGDWENIMGSYAAYPAVVEWIANYDQSCDACPINIAVDGFGDIAPTIWQYTGCEENCGTTSAYPCPYDLDIATELPA
jgi:hypothetical protein